MTPETIADYIKKPAKPFVNNDCRRVVNNLKVGVDFYGRVCTMFAVLFIQFKDNACYLVRSSKLDLKITRLEQTISFLI